jgi:hypothetical protein
MFRILLVAAALTLFQTPLLAQTVRGVLKDAAGAPVAKARVTLMDTTALVLRAAVTDIAGAFTLRTTYGGSFRLRVQHTGFLPYTSEILQLKSGEELAVTVQIDFIDTLVVDAPVVQLDPVQVNAASRELPLIVPSINAKRTSVLTPTDILGGPQTNAYDLVHSMRSHWLRGRGPASLLNTASVAVYVDGVRYGRNSVEALRQIPAASVQSMHYLDSIEAPMYFGNAAVNGAILISTRKK